MKNIFLILKHEYWVRVKKKSFIIMTLLAPLLIAILYGSIMAIAYSQISESSKKTVVISDEFNLFKDTFNSTKSYDFYFTNVNDSAQKMFDENYVDWAVFNNDKEGKNFTLLSKSGVSFVDKQILKNIIEKKLFERNVKNSGLNVKLIDSLNTSIELVEKNQEGKSNATEIKSGIGYALAFIIYLFILMYGVMIMRGVTEEKNSRIVEVIVSAVKPFQLMMGKILGVALVGLTQFLVWGLLSSVLIVVVGSIFGIQNMSQIDVQAVGEMANKSEVNSMVFGIISQLSSINFAKIIVGFGLFFLGGFLLYSALFAAIGSAVDNDTETQQFVMPVTLPLIFAFVIAQMAALKDINSSLAVTTSLIPFTSPVVMMVRLPFDISWGSIFLSAFILFATFILVVWITSKIYRIGILTYGKKASFKQMLIWIFTKN